MSVVKKGKQIIKSLAPAKVVQARLHKRVMMDFAEKVGLVYFGYVDQRSDEHRLVRGLTMSARHHDNHYCIGTFQGYDMTLVERSDTIAFPGKSTRTHNWIIMEFDLHTNIDVPHVFVGLRSHNDTFYAHLFTKFPTLAKAPLGAFGGYLPSFTNKYSVYTAPVHIEATQRIIDPSVAQVMGDHFGNLMVELYEGSVYIYAEDQRPTQALLDRMLKFGVWLAASVDVRLAPPHHNKEDSLF